MDEALFERIRQSGTAFALERAALADIAAVSEFVESELEKADVPMKTVFQFNVVIDEIMNNIVSYGYGDGAGPVRVRLAREEAPSRIYLQFEDEGVPYDPLANEDPDISLSAEDRMMGGLGILVVKKTMDDVYYRYEDGKNLLTLMKNIG